MTKTPVLKKRTYIQEDTINSVRFSKNYYTVAGASSL